MNADEAWDRLSVWMQCCSACGGPIRTIVATEKVRCVGVQRGVFSCIASGRILARVHSEMVFVASDPRGLAVPASEPFRRRIVAPKRPTTARYPGETTVSAWKAREVLREHAITSGRRWVSL